MDEKYLQANISPKPHLMYRYAGRVFPKSSEAVRIKGEVL